MDGFGNRVADITSDHRTGYNVGFWLLTTSSADIQRSWKTRNSIHELKKKNKAFQEPCRCERCLYNGSLRDAYFSKKQTRWHSVETKEVTSSVISSLVAWFDLTLFRLVLLFFVVVSSGMIHGSEKSVQCLTWKENITFLERSLLIQSVRLLLEKGTIYIMCTTARSGLGSVILWGLLLSYRVFFFIIFRVHVFTLLSLSHIRAFVEGSDVRV